MYISKRLAVALLTASALAGSAATAVTALADQGGQGRGAAHREGGNSMGEGGNSMGEGGNGMVLFTSLAPSVPTDPTLLGVAAGGVPWVLRSGEAKLHSDGRLTVRIRGLLIPSGQFAGTTGPVKTVSASLYCDANGTPVGTSGTVPLSSDGDARITAALTLPAKCLIPALLVHPNGAAGTYITTSGFGG
jgi:hypothetical protein